MGYFVLEEEGDSIWQKTIFYEFARLSQRFVCSLEFLSSTSGKSVNSLKILVLSNNLQVWGALLYRDDKFLLSLSNDCGGNRAAGKWKLQSVEQHMRPS